MITVTNEKLFAALQGFEFVYCKEKNYVGLRDVFYQKLELHNIKIETLHKIYGFEVIDTLVCGHIIEATDEIKKMFS